MIIGVAISDGAKMRLFRMAIKANNRLEECSSDEEYKKAKKRLDEWCEIIAVLGLTKELQKYSIEKKGEE